MVDDVNGKQHFSADAVEACLSLLPTGEYELVVPPNLYKYAVVIAGELGEYRGALFRSSLSVREDRGIEPTAWYLIPKEGEGE